MVTITLGTLCTGIGLIDLGLERAGLGPVRWQVEILPERRAVLAHHWPNVERFEDVRIVGAHNLAYVDCIAFGSPCKNLSSAGDRSGLDGASSRLFWECLRVVGELRPRWVVFENVASGASLWVDRVRDALEREGYATLPVPLAASDCGAPHRRGRVFVLAFLADAHRDGESPRAIDAEVASASDASDFDRANVRDEPGRECGARGGDARLLSDLGEDATNVNGARLERHRNTAQQSPARSWGPPVPDILRVVHGSSDRLDGARQRVAALGDSCTPQQAETIGWLVRMLDGR